MICVNTCSHSCWSRVNTSLLQLLVQLCPLALLTEAASRTHSPPRPSAMHKIITLVISYNSTAVQLRTVGSLSLSLSLTHSISLSLFLLPLRSLTSSSSRHPTTTPPASPPTNTVSTVCQQCVNTTSGGGVGHVSTPLFEPGVDTWPPLELAPPLEHELERHFVISSAPLHFAGVGISHWEITWR